MIDYWDYWLYGYDASVPSMQGMQSTLPTDHERDVIAELHSVVEEVTGNPVPGIQRRPIGFL